ncbi:MAG: glucan biosynthesis protein G [Candidatus Omnitrophica bacterium]|nr:glucan biosynthesis protein G [Candidatus Omnitrophota bacterium]
MEKTKMLHGKPLIIFTLSIFIATTLSSGAGAQEIKTKNAMAFEDVCKFAEKLANASFESARDQNIPKFLKDLTYDQYRDIRYKPEKALWKSEKLPFQIQFFHTGSIYDIPVKINIIEDNTVHPFPFSADLFDYGKNDLSGKIPDNMGYTGFRIHSPINTPTYFDEFAVFLGASYFRAVGKGQVYGLSARGLAIDTATEAGEEFPYFKEFWLIKPRAGSRDIKIYALLDSPSVSGAYCFVIKPGKETQIAVNSRLYFRKKIKKLGIAPLTSMFLFGENAPTYGERDFRPEVHDSDGVEVKIGDTDNLWRPLVNRKTLFINSFRADGLREYGLVQRDRNFDHYQDLESRYDKRPGVTVTPNKYWRTGAVELVQLPCDKEYNDNIAAYWVPDNSGDLPNPVTFSYTLKWSLWDNSNEDLGYITDTRSEKSSDGRKLKFVIDYAWAKSNALPEGSAVDTDISISDQRYELTEFQIMKNTVTGGWRLVLVLSERDSLIPSDILPSLRPATELRAFLKNGGKRITEIWSYGVQ